AACGARASRARHQKYPRIPVKNTSSDSSRLKKGIGLKIGNVLIMRGFRILTVVFRRSPF
ncbi:MAG TPA: hypothetical protein VMT22_07270, partial [Terriglobales bacterium]|nr:hypothetical protein [Terriglobales bacterium]